MSGLLNVLIFFSPVILVCLLVFAFCIYHGAFMFPAIKEDFKFESRGIEYKYTYAGGAIRLRYEVEDILVSISQKEFFPIVKINRYQVSSRQKREVLKSLRHIPKILAERSKEKKLAKQLVVNEEGLSLEELVQRVSFKSVRQAKEDELAIYLSSNSKPERTIAEIRYKELEKNSDNI